MHCKLGGCGGRYCANVFMGSEDICWISEEISNRDDATLGNCSKLSHRVLSHLVKGVVVPWDPDRVFKDLKPLLPLIWLIVKEQLFKFIHDI